MRVVRVIIAFAFLVGGVITWFLLRLLHGLALAIGGMSAGPGSAPPSIDAIIPWLACSYFAISSAGFFICNKKQALQIVALIAHIVLLFAFLAICSEGGEMDTEKFLRSLLELGVILALYFSPWLVIWSAFLLRQKENV